MLGGQNTYKINPNKKKVLSMISISLFVIALISLGTYAIWNSELFTSNNTITSGQIKMSYTESNEISLNNALPIKDEEGKLLTNYFDFQVLSYIKTKASDSTERKLNYNIILEPISVENPLSDSEIKVYLTKVESGVETVVVEPTTIEKLNNYILNSQEEIFKNNKSEVITTYRLRAWIDENVDTNKLNEKTYSYKFRVNVNNEKQSDITLTALNFAQANVGQNGLELVTHTIDDTLQVTSDFATEYRYRGGTVNNYVTFNNETWRIIGIIPTEDTDGNIEYRFKLIRDESIGEYEWDSETAITYNYNNDDSIKLLNANKNSSNDLNNLIEYNNEYDIIKTAADFGCDNCDNNWAKPSALNTYLNDTYYNSLSTDAQSMIGTTKYYLGGYSSSEITSDTMWQYERKNEANRTGYYYGTNPIMQSDASKKIALMYASDYGYAASTSCTVNLSGYGEDNKCITTNNWLDKSADTWLLSQSLDSNYGLPYVFYIDSESSGKVTSAPSYKAFSYLYNNITVRPVLTLSSSVKISSGSGTSSNPYALSIE